MKKVWKPVEGEPMYWVSSDGQVWSRKTRRRLVGGNTGRYATVILSGKSRYVHHLVARAFIGPRPLGLQIRHLDDNNFNNAASNLAYGTPSENALDRERAKREGKPIHRRTAANPWKRKPRMARKAKLTASLPKLAVSPELRERVEKVADAAEVGMADVVRDCILAMLPQLELQYGLLDLDKLEPDVLNSLGLTRQEEAPAQPVTEDRAKGCFGWTPPTA